MRETFERHLVQRAAKLVEETIDERREELAARLAELEQRSRELAAVESKLARLGARLDAAGAADGSWADRVEHLVSELESARVDAEREQQARRVSERDLREALLRVEETEALSRRAAKLDVREAELEQRAVEVDERVDALARGDQVRDRLEQAPVLLRELDARERALEERERQLDVGERFVLRERTRLEEVAERGRELEERLRERESDLVRLDQAATEAAAAWEAEVELRTRQLRRAESSVEERERRITAREDALARYVRDAQAAPVTS
jgi:hypothetical protein